MVFPQSAKVGEGAKNPNFPAIFPLIGVGALSFDSPETPVVPFYSSVFAQLMKDIIHGG